MPINAKLVVVGGEVKTAEIKLRLPTTIGRGRGCTIMLPQALVSRQHCEIFESSGQLMVRDLGSLNGTFVNNQKIAEAAPVNSEELLTIGTVTFRVVYEGAGATSPPPGPGPVIKTPSTAKEKLPAARVVAAGSVAVKGTVTASDADDLSEPIEIGDFNFDDTVRPNSDESSSAPVAVQAKAPAEPVVPVINIGEPVRKPAAAPVIAATKPTPSAPTLAAPSPLAKTAVPAPAAPGAKAPAAEEEKEAEDDFQDFLKSLGK
jgi:predicted component of type VI protein secretion system